MLLMIIKAVTMYKLTKQSNLVFLLLHIIFFLTDYEQIS